jgi:hypothetical protein
VIKFSIFLFVVAFLALGIALAPMVSPNDTTLLNLLEPLLCDSGDNILQEVASTPRRVDSTSNAFVIDMSLMCKRADGSSYSVTDKLFGVGMIAFITFLLFGVLFLIIGIIRAMSGGGGGKPQPAGTGWTPPYYAPTPTPTPSGGAYPQVTVTPQTFGSYSTTAGYNAPTASVGTSTPSDRFNFDAAQTMQNIPKPSTGASSGQGGDLTARLKQLREAYDSGLISSEEYERTRADLLKDFSDDN